MQPPDSGGISTPGSSKTWTWKLSPTLAPQIKDKSQTCVQSRSQETPKMNPKINKNGHLDLKVPVGCPCGSLDRQNGPQGLQIGSSRSPKTTVLHTKGDPFQQSTSQQFPAAKVSKPKLLSQSSQANIPKPKFPSQRS